MKSIGRRRAMQLAAAIGGLAGRPLVRRHVRLVVAARDFRCNAILHGCSAYVVQVDPAR